MKIVVPAIFPVRKVKLELDVSGQADAGEYLVAPHGFTESGRRIGDRRLSWPVHSSRLGIAALPLPALGPQVETVRMELEMSTPAAVMQFEIVDWRSEIAVRGIEIHTCRWYAQAGVPRLYASGTIDGKEWQ